MTEGKEIEENTLEFIKRKFIKKKNSNFLNYTNPINHINKGYGNNIIKTHAPNANSISINTSLQNNTKISSDDKSKTLNHTLNKIIISPREEIKEINENNNKININNDNNNDNNNNDKKSENNNNKINNLNSNNNLIEDENDKIIEIIKKSNVIKKPKYLFKLNTSKELNTMRNIEDIKDFIEDNLKTQKNFFPLFSKIKEQ
jgi:hypothetical protein